MSILTIQSLIGRKQRLETDEDSSAERGKKKKKKFLGKKVFKVDLKMGPERVPVGEEWNVM